MMSYMEQQMQQQIEGAEYRANEISEQLDLFEDFYLSQADVDATLM